MALVAASASIRAAGAQTGDGFVGVYEDSLGTQPCAAIAPYHGATLYVIGNLAGATSSGITGAEFRIEVTSPAGWLFSYSEPPNARVTLGNPMDLDPANPDDGSGVNISFAECQAPSSSGMIQLGTISVFNMSGQPTDLLVKRHSRPSNPTTQCPLFVLCDAPIYSKLCMSSAPDPWCTLGPGKARTSAGDDEPVYASNVYNNISGVVGTLPDSVPDAAGWPLQAFVAGEPQVRGFIRADLATCTEVDQLSEGITLEEHDGAWGQVLVDWPGLHALSRRGYVLFPERLPDRMAPAAKAEPAPPRSQLQILIYEEDFNGREVPSSEWPVDPVPQGDCYWGSALNDNYLFCSRYYKDSSGNQQTCNPYSGYDDNMNTWVRNTGLNGSNGIYCGNATSITVTINYSGSTQPSLDKLWIGTTFCDDVQGCITVSHQYSGDFDDPANPAHSPAIFTELNPRERLYFEFGFYSNGLNHDYEGARIDRIEVWADVTPFNLRSTIASVTDVFPYDPYRRNVTIETVNDGPAAAPVTRSGLKRFYSITQPEPTEEDFEHTWDVPALAPYSTHPQTLVIDFDPTTSKTLTELIPEDLRSHADVGGWATESNENDNGHSFPTMYWSIELPPIIIVPGLMGSELEKYISGVPTVVWSANELSTARTLLTHHDRLLLTPFEDEVVGGPMTSIGLLRQTTPPDGFSHLTSLLRTMAQLPYLDDVGALDHFRQNPNIWTGVIETLQSHGYHTDGADPNLFEFHYDWRKQVQHPATFGALENLIDQARAANPVSKDYLTIVSLSGGGFVVQGYANSKNQASQPHHIYSWISLGCPFQGSPEAFASLLGADHLARKIPGVLGEIYCRRMREIAQTSSGVQTMLPTPAFNRIIYQRGDPRPYPAPSASFITWSGTFQDVLTNPNQMPPDWELNTTVYNRAQTFHNQYTGPTGIPHVYHVINRDFDTLDRIVWHLETNIPLKRTPGLYVDKDRFDLECTFGGGDEIVPEQSALDGDPGAHYYHLQNTRHRDMADHGSVGELVWLRAKNPSDPTLPFGFSQIGKPGPGDRTLTGSTHTLVFQFRVYEFWLPSNPMDAPFPVAIELYNRDTGQMMIGTYRLLENGNPSEIAATMEMGAPCLNWSSGDRSQQFWAADLPDGYYRLVLLPSPDFWYPNDPDPGPFKIYGQLAMRDAVKIWSAPSVTYPDSQVEFNGVNGSGGSNLGFSAYVDLTIVGGAIQGTEWLLHIDKDGDGYEDGTVTSVHHEETPESVGLRWPLAMQPNPFRESTTVRWSSTIGVPRHVEVYRVDGRRVRSATIQPDDRSFLWDGNSDTGEQQPSGPYVIRIRDASGRMLASQKVVRLR